MNFQKWVVIIALILLILILIGIGLTLKKGTQHWPPTVSNCPDYWEDELGDGKSCINVKQLGTCNIPSDDENNAMDFTQDQFINNDCGKYKWAKKCGVVWDGITSGVTNPCDNKLK